MTSCQGAKGTGTLYSYAQLEQLWINAGGSKTLAPTMAAIAMAESGGCSTAYNPSGATGLWQILGAVNPADQGNLTSPTVNAKEAVLKYQSQGLGAWTTYTSGAYKQYLSPGTTPDANVPASGSVSTTSATTDTSACLVGAGEGGLFGIGSFKACFLTKSEARALIGGLCLIGGGVVCAVGLAFIAVFAVGKSGIARTVVSAVR